MAAPKENENAEKFEEIIELIEDGMSLRKACIKLGMSTRTFYNWIEQDEVKQQQYARAIICRADSIFEEILDIADDSSGDKKFTEKGEVIDSEYVQRSKLRVDARKWAVSKMNPKKYGDRVLNENLNKNIDFSNMTDKEFEEELRKVNRVLNG
tara:strand:+ start:20955 stop:21413 length:459 start_codon:yes stop_codon:yes gene_type:complete